MIWKRFLLSHHVNLNIPEGKRAETTWFVAIVLVVCVCVCVCLHTSTLWERERERERENEKHKRVSQWVILLCSRFSKSSELTLSEPMSTADTVNSLSHIPDIQLSGQYQRSLAEAVGGGEICWAADQIQIVTLSAILEVWFPLPNLPSSFLA